MDIMIPSIKGVYRDWLYNTEGRLLYDSGWQDNKIVNSCHVLLAHLMKGGGKSGTEETGIVFLQIGSGYQDWDQEIPPIENQTPSLSQPYPNKYQLELKFIQADSDPPVQSDEPTNCIQASVTLEAGEPNVAEGESTFLREFGLFGRAGDTEYMIDCIRHPLIQKDSTMTLTRVIRLTF